MKIELEASGRLPLRDTCDRRFLQAMVNRCIVGFHRYGPFHQIGRHTRSWKPPMDRLKECLRKYERTGNRELLIDLANYAMSEFTNPHHPKAHYKALDQGIFESEK